MGFLICCCSSPTTPGCFCPSGPLTVTAIVTSPDSVLSDASIPMTWSPSVATGIPDAYKSDSSYIDVNSGDTFYYLIYCGLTYYLMTRFFPASVTIDPERYRWRATVSGEVTCTPFGLTGGVRGSYLGTATVTLS